MLTIFDSEQGSPRRQGLVVKERDAKDKGQDVEEGKVARNHQDDLKGDLNESRESSDPCHRGKEEKGDQDLDYQRRCH